MASPKRPHPIAAVVTLTLALLLLIPGISDIPQDRDEARFIWTGAYYAGRLARFDFSQSGPDLLGNPGWSPASAWAQTQPMGTRFLFGAALGISKTAAPASPPSLTDDRAEGPESTVSLAALRVARLAAASLGAIGLSLFAWRLGWPAMVAALGLLTVPNARETLARAWAEGPLLFALGLGALAWGSRWFPIVVGIATSFKLTALGLWPLALWPRASGGMRPLLAILVVALTWTALTPPAWFYIGPAYLIVMLLAHLSELSAHATATGSLVAYLTTRQIWPLELGCLLGIAIVFASRFARLKRERWVGVAQRMRLSSYVSRTGQPHPTAE